mgnify:CR=1 FL=1
MATQIDPHTPQNRFTTGRSLTATRPLMGWRTVDILTIAFLGAALGVAIWGWGVLYNGPFTALKIGYAPLMGLFAGPWFLAGVVGTLTSKLPADEEILLVGIEADDILTFGDECTPAVRAAIPRAVQEVLTALDASPASPDPRR